MLFSGIFWYWKNQDMDSRIWYKNSLFKRNPNLFFMVVFLWMCLGGIPSTNSVWIPLGYSDVYADDIMFDAASSPAASGVDTNTTLSWQHTIGCERSRVLIVGVEVEDTSAADSVVSSVTYNGVNMTRAVSVQQSSTGFIMDVEIWYLLEANLPDAGSYTITVTTTGPTRERYGGGISLYNVLQAAPEATSTQTTGSPPATFNTTITTLTNGAWVVDAIGSGNFNSAFTTSQMGQVERYDSGTTGGSSTGAGSTKPVATAGLTTMGWNQTGANRMAHVLAAFAPDPSPAATDTCPSTSTITFRAKQTASSANAASLIVTKPTGTATGDLLIATMTFDDGGDTLSAPVDWTLIEPASPGAEQMRTRSWYKIAQAGEPASYTFSSSGGNDNTIVHIAAFYDTRGVNVTGWTLEDSSYAYQDTTSTTITSLTVTGVTNGLLYTGFSNDDQEVVSSAPGGMTELDSQNVATVSLATYYEFRGAGAVTKTISWGGAADEYAAIAAVFSWSATSTGEGVGSNQGTTISWSHTIGGGDNRLLVVGAEIEDGIAANAVVSGVTYNGVAMLPAVSVAATNGFSNNVSLWYMLEASLPVAGTYTVTVTTTGTTDNRIGGSVDFADMKQAAPEATNTQTTTTGPYDPFNTTITTLTDGAIVVDAIGSGSNAPAGFTTNQTGQVERYDSDSAGVGSTGAGSSKAVATAGSTTMGWDVTFTNNRLAHVVAAFAPADTPTPATDLTVTSFNSASDVHWDNPGGDLTNVLILAKTADCTFTLNPLGTEAINTTVGNGVVLFNNDPTANLGSTAVTVGGATTVSYTASTGRLMHSSLTNSTTYCYKLYIRNGGILDDKSGSGRPEVEATATNGVSPNPRWSLNLESTNGATLVPPGLDPGSQVFTSFGSGTMVAVGAADGILDWRTLPASGSIQDQSPVLPISGGANCGVAGATNCLIATSQDGFVYSLNAATGVTTWSYRHAVADMLQGAVGAQLKDYTNVGFTPLTDLLFVTTRNASTTANKVYALNPTSAPASPSWLFTGGGATSMDMINAAPVVDYDNNRIYVTSSSNGNTQRSLWAFNSTNGTLLSTGTTYGGTTVGDITVSPALSDDAGTVYVGTAGGSVRAYNTSDGSLKWTLATSSAVVSTLWLDSASDDLFFSTANGTVWRVSDDGGSASDVWGGSKPVFTSATLPLVLGGTDKVFVGGCTGASCASSSEGRVYQVNATTGAREQCRILGTNVTPGDPAFDVVDGQLLAGASNGKVYAFAAPAGILGSDPACIP